MVFESSVSIDEVFVRTATVSLINSGSPQSSTYILHVSDIWTLHCSSTPCGVKNNRSDLACLPRHSHAWIDSIVCATELLLVVRHPGVWLSVYGQLHQMWSCQRCKVAASNEHSSMVLAHSSTHDSISLVSAMRAAIHQGDWVCAKARSEAHRLSIVVAMLVGLREAQSSRNKLSTKLWWCRSVMISSKKLPFVTTCFRLAM